MLRNASTNEQNVTYDNSKAASDASDASEAITCNPNYIVHVRWGFLSGAG